MEKNANKFTGSYQSPMDLNGNTRLIVTFNEKASGSKGVEWAFGRRSCMHCIDPACVSVCPSGTLHVDEDTGFVAVDEEKCIGCQYCSSACPFDVPRYHGNNSKVNKCHGCIDRLAQGRVPACVKTCAPGALQVGDRDEILAIAHERVAYLHGKGFSQARIYGEDELQGLHVITVMKFGIEAYGLPENPKVNELIGILDFMKPLAAVGVGATVLGLGLSFLTGVGYKRHEMRYDEKARDVIDVETGEVIKHINEGEE